MGLFQSPPRTDDELEAARPIAFPPDVVQSFDEGEWYARAYQRDSPQLTVRAVALGSVLGFFLSFTNVYIGLKTGWFLGINLTAAILSFGVWRALGALGLVKTPLTILEQTSAVSTASSAGYATGNMVVAAIPAMLLLSVTESLPGGTQLHWAVLALWIFFLAALGVVLAIPMKRGMINHERLKFPSGTAAAVLLRSLHASGAAAIARTRALVAAATLSGIVPLLKDLAVRRGTVGSARVALLPAQSNVFDGLTSLLPERWTRHLLLAGPPQLHPGGAPLLLSAYQIKLDHGVALVFAGIIVGLRVAGWMAIAGLFFAVVVTPGALDVGAVTQPETAWKELGIWLGAPVLIAGGLVQLLLQWRTVGRAVAALVPRRSPDAAASDAEVPPRWFFAGLLFAGGGVIVVARWAFGVPLLLGVLAVAMTFVLATVACRATGESDLTPGSALGKIVQLAYGVLLPQNAAANLQTGAITAGASIASADLLTDLKCGYLLGASPRRQFVAQAAGIVSGTVATVLGYFILVPDATALTGTATTPPAFPAPNAMLWKTVAEVLGHGLGALHPWAQRGAVVGAVLGVVLGLAEALLPPRWRRLVPSPTGIGLGLLLPFYYPLAMFVGALFGEIATRTRRAWADAYLVAIAAGGIAGESIVGVAVQALNHFVLGAG